MCQPRCMPASTGGRLTHMRRMTEPKRGRAVKTHGQLASWLPIFAVGALAPPMTPLVMSKDLSKSLDATRV
jgi:hypothetical protein